MIKKILIALAIIAVLYFLFRPPKIKNSTNADIIFYYGQECSHCHNVLKYIADNKIDEKIKIESKEVYHNDANKNELTALTRICPEISDNGNIGVPVAYIVKENKCLGGDSPIIDKLKTMLQ